MSYFQHENITVTTAADGTATAYSAKTYNGRIQCVDYIKTDFADGVDFTITTENTAHEVWTGTDVNASRFMRPRSTVHDTTGGVLQHGSANPVVADYIPMVNERLKIVIAQGGNAKTGTFRLVVGG
jgi:hypothetical protein